MQSLWNSNAHIFIFQLYGGNQQSVIHFIIFFVRLRYEYVDFWMHAISIFKMDLIVLPRIIVPYFDTDLIINRNVKQGKPHTCGDDKQRDLWYLSHWHIANNSVDMEGNRHVIKLTSLSTIHGTIFMIGAF